MKVVIIEPMKEPRKAVIRNDLMSMHELVGGYLETVQLKDCVMVCNEEGALRRLPFCRLVAGHLMHGTIFFCNVDYRRHDFTDISDEAAERILKEYKRPEELILRDDGSVTIMRLAAG